jgi:hypothetical protein
MANKRIFYSCQQASIAPAGTTTFGASHTVHGLQSLGINTRFNLEQVFEIGQLAIYQNIENLPDVEITLEKVIDGYPLIYHLATKGAPSATLSGRSNIRSSFCASFFPDTNDSCTGTPNSEVECSGTFVSALNYNMPVEGNCTESVTLVGNNKIWRVPPASMEFAGQFSGNNDEPIGSGGVQRRQHVIFGTGARASVLPVDVDGIDVNGHNVQDSNGDFAAHVQSIRVSANLGREQMHELGRKGPYHRYVSFPVEVRTDIEVITTRGDLVSATEVGVLGDGNNLDDRTIVINLLEGTHIDLGTKNKLNSVTYGGANAGGRGGNATVTYSYTTFNDCTVKHPQDPTTALWP